MAGKEPRPGSDFHGHPSVRRFAFEIFKRTAGRGAQVIFTTAYDEYATHAFRVNAVDYLLKPLAIDEVKRALEKYRKLSRPPGTPGYREVV